MIFLFPRCAECQALTAPTVWYSLYEREKVVPLDAPLARCPDHDPIMQAVLRSKKETGIG